jgi:hypothetical protein
VFLGLEGSGVGIPPTGTPLGQPLSGNSTIELDDASIRFVAAADGRGDGLAAADLVASNRSRAGETLELCGLRFNRV